MSDPANCATCSALIEDTQVTGIFCAKCHGAETDQGGDWRQYLSAPSVIGLAAVAVPLGAHVTVNGLDYVKAGGGAVALLFGIIALVTATKAPAELRKAKLGIGIAIVLGGLFHLLGSGILA